MSRPFAHETDVPSLPLSGQAAKPAAGALTGLASVLKPFQEGRTPVYIEYRRPDASARLRLGEEWRVNPTEELLRRLGDLAGSDRVRVEY